MENKKIRSVLSLIITVFTLIIIAGFFYIAHITGASDLREVSAVGTLPASESQAPTALPSAALYILREYDGQIAVFVPQNEDIPVSLTGILTSTLRQSDREELQRGIYVAGSLELAQRLEDFGS